MPTYKQIDNLLEQAKAVQQSKQRGKFFRNNQEEGRKNTMENTIYDENNGLWYAKRGNYYLPYINLPVSGRLNEYLASIDEQTEDMFSRLVKKNADKQGVTEQLKEENQLE